jgi:hypothetical protein
LDSSDSESESLVEFEVEPEVASELEVEPEVVVSDLV